MIIERPLELGQPRRDVWCSSSEISDNGDGTYSFVNLPNEALGYGSKIYVVDSPNTILYFDNETGVLYPWTEQSPYILPIASDNELGGIKVGEGLYIDSNGVLSVSNTGVLFVGKATETLAAGLTTATVNYTDNFITAFATMNGVKVEIDITIGNDSVVFDVAEALDDDILCTVIYGTESSE